MFLKLGKFKMLLMIYDYPGSELLFLALKLEILCTGNI